MSEPHEIKIRALPRSSPKSKKGDDKGKKNPRWIIYVGTSGGLVVLALFMMAQKPQPHSSAKLRGQVDMASVDPRIYDSISQHLQDSEIQHKMLMRKRELENIPFRDAKFEPNLDDVETLPDNTNMGVQMESETGFEQVLEDLQPQTGNNNDLLPADKINARLADRKWMNEMEREDRIRFIGGFIRAAYEKGYEVEIDQDLVVVGVRKLNRHQTLNINQVIDRLAKQGQ